MRSRKRRRPSTKQDRLAAAICHDGPRQQGKRHEQNATSRWRLWLALTCLRFGRPGAARSWPAGRSCGSVPSPLCGLFEAFTAKVISFTTEIPNSDWPAQTSSRRRAQGRTTFREGLSGGCLVWRRRRKAANNRADRLAEERQSGPLGLSIRWSSMPREAWRTTTRSLSQPCLPQFDAQASPLALYASRLPAMWNSLFPRRCTSCLECRGVGEGSGGRASRYASKAGHTRTSSS